MFAILKEVLSILKEVHSIFWLLSFANQIADIEF